MQMANKGNVVLYLDKELVEKSKELGFNFSKTFKKLETLNHWIFSIIYAKLRKFK